MAVSLYKDSENSPGERIFLKNDPETGEPSYAFVRKLGPEKLKQLQRPFERPVKRKGKPRTWSLPSKNTEAYGETCLDWAFLDMENYVIRVDDVGAAEFFGMELGMAVSVGDEITLDKRLTKKIKTFITDRDTVVAVKVAGAAGLSADDAEEDDTDDREREEFLEGNSQTGSTSDSDTPKRTATSAMSQTRVGPVQNVESLNKN